MTTFLCLNFFPSCRILLLHKMPGVKRKFSAAVANSSRGDPRGFPGILVMCAQTKETKALHTVADTLRDYIEQYFPSMLKKNQLQDESISEDAELHQLDQQKSSSSLADELAAELADIRGSDVVFDSVNQTFSHSKKKSRENEIIVPQFRNLGRALGMVWFPNKDLDIVFLVNQILTDAKNKVLPELYSIVRMIPIQRFVTAYLDNITDYITEQIPSALKSLLANTSSNGHADTSKPSWIFEFNHRNNDKINRHHMHQLCLDRIAPLNIAYSKEKSGTFVVVMEVVLAFVGFSVIRFEDWKNFCRYNYKLVTESEEEKRIRLAQSTKSLSKEEKEVAGENETQVTVNSSNQSQPPESKDEPSVVHDTEKYLFYVENPSDNSSEKSRAILEYTEIDGILSLNHTFTPESLRGKGIAAKLCSAAFQYAALHRLKVKPVCTYVSQTFGPKHAPDLGFHLDSTKGIYELEVSEAN
jgi:uncharacterized protein